LEAVTYLLVILSDPSWPDLHKADVWQNNLHITNQSILTDFDYLQAPPSSTP